MLPSDSLLSLAPAQSTAPLLLLLGSRFRSGGRSSTRLILLLLDHLWLCGAFSRSRLRRGFLRFGYWSGYGQNNTFLVPDDFRTGRNLDFTKVDGIPNFKVRDVHLKALGEIFRKRANLDFEDHVFENPATRLNPYRFSRGLDGNRDRHHFCLDDFMQVNMEHMPAQSMMLYILNKRQAPGLGVTAHFQIQEDVF